MKGIESKEEEKSSDNKKLVCFGMSRGVLFIMFKMGEKIMIQGQKFELSSFKSKGPN